MLRETSPGVDPLGPDNVLVLALGVLTGAPISGQSRMTAVARSPLTEAIGDSQCGGFFPAEMKFAGFDALVLRGRADEPLYLWIHEGTPELRPAAHLWGKITGEVEDILRGELGDDKIEVLQCGPAGERGVRFAALMNMANRANGRTGMGAVMGSKNLKAIVVRGTAKPSLADRAKVIEAGPLGRQATSRSRTSTGWGCSAPPRCWPGRTRPAACRRATGRAAPSTTTWPSTAGRCRRRS